MFRNTHRIFYLLVIALSTIIVQFACETESGKLPSIKVRDSQGSIFYDTTAAMNDTLRFNIEANGGEYAITNFVVEINGAKFIDSSMNAMDLNVTVTIIKSADSIEAIRFIVTNRTGNSAMSKITVSLKGDVSWNSVDSYSQIVFGAQNHIDTGGFFSFVDSMVWNIQDAFNHQPNIHLLYYYDNTGDDNTISSPGANIDSTVFPGIYGLDNWTTKNTTRFKSTTITQQQFNNIINDSLLVETYGTVNGTRKAKNLVPGNVFSFKTQDGKCGLFRVLKVNGTYSGSIAVDIKIQK